MEINRNQYFMFGIIILLLGIQFRLVDTYELNQDTTQFLARRSGQTESTSGLLMATAQLTGAQMTGATKKVKPPQWIGWCLISIGSVLILHSFAMKRPE